jgi:hypothetical protein
MWSPLVTRLVAKRDRDRQRLPTVDTRNRQGNTRAESPNDLEPCGRGNHDEARHETAALIVNEKFEGAHL